MVERTDRIAVAYLRLSGRGQVDGDGLTRQREAISQWAAATGTRIQAWYEDQGASGASRDRTALVELLVDLESGGPGVVVFERLDRLARDVVVQESIIDELRQLGVTPVSTAEPDLVGDDPSRMLIRTVIGAVAAYERQLTTQKLAAARRRQRLSQGKCEGRKAYGEVDALERDVVGHMRYLRRYRRLTPYGIAKALNAMGILSRSGGRWRPTTVQRILAGPHAAAAPFLKVLPART